DQHDSTGAYPEQWTKPRNSKRCTDNCGRDVQGEIRAPEELLHAEDVGSDSTERAEYRSGNGVTRVRSMSASFLHRPKLPRHPRQSRLRAGNRQSAPRRVATAS